MSNSSFTVVSVAINRPVFAEYAYMVDGVIAEECLGSRIEINFAGSKQIGIITRINPELGIELSKVKKGRLLDQKSFISSDIMELLAFGSSYYSYPLGQCYNVAIPKLLRDGGRFAYESIPALELNDDFDESLKAKIKSPEQLQILDILKDGPVKRKELRERGFSSSSENALIKKGAVKLTEYEYRYKKFYEDDKDILKETPLSPNPEQENAIVTVSAHQGFGVFLLNGITGSGKTEVYLRIIEKVLKEHKSVLVLVPEISLTPQTFNRFYRRFNVPVSSMHSAMSDRERLDAYIDMATEKSGILIGTRTALFTPIPRLGLIVIDEEHDSSFKQTDSFRYHARSLAIMRAKINNCPLVLGSATPSVDTFYNVHKGLYQKIDLTIRAGGASTPDFSVIDLCHEPLTEGLRTGISETLEREIGEETARGNQVLLFLNRRGYSHHIVCHTCGHVFMCPHCDNLLTVHKMNNRLQCHICENNLPLPKQCPKCGSHELMEEGFGTEQVAEFLARRYPDVGIERIDRDTVTTKKQLESRLARIKSGASKIMLGTQMLAKGHDFPDVTLVAMLDIDSLLFSDDYRSIENAAQLLTQVAGRSGRGEKKGRVIIQTHHKDNMLINQLISPQCRYIDVAAGILETRKKLMLPPYTRQAFLLCNSADRQKAYAFMVELNKKITSVLSSFSNLVITRVMSDKMEKQQNRYHFHMLVTALNRSTMSAFLKEVRNMVAGISVPADVRFAIEVDPIIMY